MNKYKLIRKNCALSYPYSNHITAFRESSLHHLRCPLVIIIFTPPRINCPLPSVIKPQTSRDKKVNQRAQGELNLKRRVIKFHFANLIKHRVHDTNLLCYSVNSSGVIDCPLGKVVRGFWFGGFSGFPDC